MPSSEPTDVCSTYGWENDCSDDPNFRSVLGLPCANHQVLICQELHHIMDPPDMDALIIACPCSCQIECGTWSGSPTLSPTTSAHMIANRVVETSTPSSRPTSSPSLRPTSTPSSRPTSSPSLRPSPGSNKQISSPSPPPTTPVNTRSPTFIQMTSAPTPSRISIPVSSAPRIALPTALSQPSGDGNVESDSSAGISVASSSEQEQNTEVSTETTDASILTMVCIGLFSFAAAVLFILFFQKRREKRSLHSYMKSKVWDQTSVDVEISTPESKVIEMEVSNNSGSGSIYDDSPSVVERSVNAAVEAMGHSESSESESTNIETTSTVSGEIETTNTETPAKDDAISFSTDVETAVPHAPADDVEQQCKLHCFGLEKLLGLAPKTTSKGRDERQEHEGGGQTLSQEESSPSLQPRGLQARMPLNPEEAYRSSAKRNLSDVLGHAGVALTPEEAYGLSDEIVKTRQTNYGGSTLVAEEGNAVTHVPSMSSKPFDRDVVIDTTTSAPMPPYHQAHSGRHLHTSYLDETENDRGSSAMPQPANQPGTSFPQRPISIEARTISHKGSELSEAKIELGGYAFQFGRRSGSFRTPAP